LRSRWTAWRSLATTKNLIGRQCTYSDVHGVILCCTQIIHDFVRGEEAKSVWQVLEVLDDAENARKIVGVVRSPWFRTVDALSWQGRVDVEDHVNSSGVEDRGALRVVKVGVNIVDTNCVHLCIVSTDVLLVG
jgi:hypothetical protein